MKLLHTSDWHLGKILHEHSLIEDQKHFLDKLVEHIKQTKYDAIIIAGDIYDRSLPSREAVLLLSQFLQDLRKISDVPVILIPGNHDSAGRLSYCADLIAMTGIYIRTDPHTIDVPVKIGDLDIYCIPFLDPYTFAIQKKGEDRSERSHEHALQTAVDAINMVKETERINILVVHCFTRGGNVSDSERSFVGASGEVAATLFNGFDYVALGHLHRPQQPTDHIVYSGSPLKYSFSEAGDTKRLVAVTVESGGMSVENITIPPKRELSRISGTIDNLQNNSQFDAVTDHYLEVEITDQVLVVNPLRELEKRFPFILSIRRKQQETSTSDISMVENRGLDINDDFAGFQEYIHGDQNTLQSAKKKLFEQAVHLLQSGEVELETD